MSDDLVQENARYRRLLQETLSLFQNFGVKPGIGMDGKLMDRIQAEVSGKVIMFDPNAMRACPLCKAPNFKDCDCPADEQIAAMGGL